MRKLNFAVAIGWVAGAMFLTAMADAETAEGVLDPRTYVRPITKPHPVPQQKTVHVKIPESPAAASSTALESGIGMSALRTLSASSAPGSTTAAPGTPLTPPLNITYGGSSPALLVTDSGSNKGIESVIVNSKNQTSAVYGETNGSGAGVTGYNTGLTGPAGKFQVTDTHTYFPAVSAVSLGLGPAVVATISNNGSPYGAAAVSGINNTNAGAGVEGDGNGADGVRGTSDIGAGVSAESVNGTAVFAVSDSGDYAVFASNNDGGAIYAQTHDGVGEYVDADDGIGIQVSTGSGIGIHVYSDGAPALYAESAGEYGIWGQSMNAVGVMGKDSGSGYGIYGSSVSGYAGYFDGKVAATSFVTLSDRESKTNLRPIDAEAMLARISRLPVSSWDFKDDLDTRHVGPMAQDFHAAFGLGGKDDKHINLADIAGVSLVAIQQLNAKLQVKDAQIANLTAQLAAQAQAVADLKSLTEQLAARMKNVEHR